MEKIKKSLLLLILTPALAFSAGGEYAFPKEELAGDMHNSVSLLNGAKLYVNYCLGCHSLKYQRYNRLAKDTGVTDEVIKNNLIFNNADVKGPMLSSVSSKQSEKWFGKVPPDLSLTARAKGKDYIHNYLLGFYVDNKKPTGVNNSVFPDVGMPHVLSSLEGLKKPVYEESKDHLGNSVKHITGFESIKKGTSSPSEYKNTVYDISNFLYYVSDPSKIKRDKLGWKVLLYLSFMAVIFYGLKRAYWKNIH